MNRVITIGREFGSGGRELGKRLAELLDCAYYDKEIVEEIAKRTQLAEGYVQQIVEHRSGIFFPITVGRTLHHVHPAGTDYMLKQYTSVYAEQANVLREMAEKSADDRKRMSENARNYYETNFTMDKLVSHLEEMMMKASK